MKLPRKQAAFIHDAIDQWTHDGLLPTSQAAQLAATIEVQVFDWRRLEKYSQVVHWRSKRIRRRTGFFAARSRWDCCISLSLSGSRRFSAIMATGPYGNG